MTNSPSNEHAEHDNHEDDELQASKRQKLDNDTKKPSIDEGRDGSRDQNETSNNDTHDSRIGRVNGNDDDVAVSSSSSPAATSTTKPSTSTNSSSHSTLYIGGLDPRVLKVHLEKMLGRYGTIQRLHCVYRDSNRGPSNHGVAGRSPHHPQQDRSHNNNQNNNNNHHQYWFAFCQMATVAQAEAARRALDGQILLGKHLVVRPANHDSATFSSHGAGMTPPTQVAAGSAGASSSSSSSSQLPTTVSASKLESQQRSLEDKISAIKRKLQQHQQNKLL